MEELSEEQKDRKDGRKARISSASSSSVLPIPPSQFVSFWSEMKKKAPIRPSSKPRKKIKEWNKIIK